MRVFFSIRFFFYLLIVFSFLIFTPQTLAVEDWIVNNFQSNITIQQDGRAGIVETIDTDFNLLQKHGIIRDLPYIYQLDGGQNVYTDIQVLSVLQNSQVATYQLEKSGNFLSLKIGDPDRTISGKVQYKIQYIVTGVLRSFEDQDELYWDVTGSGWTVPIEKASVTVVLPQNGITGARCFEGLQGSTETCTATIISQQQANFSSNRTLQPEENMTAILGYTKGLVPILTASIPRTQTDNNTLAPLLLLVNIGGFLTVVIFGIGSALFLFYKHGRDQKDGVTDTVVAQYVAPDKLRPAEVGTILDERADTLDVSATIVDLAARGFLTIKEEPKKWLFGSTDYILSKTNKDTGSLLEYEKELFERLFDKKSSVKISELEEEFYDDLVEVKKMLYENVVQKKYFSQNPESARNKYIGFGLGIFISGVVLSFAIFPLIGIWIGLAIFGLAFLLISRHMPRRTNLGFQTYRNILGFKLFIDKAENYRQQFFERENIFNEILPYAIVFGNTEKFAKAFQDLGIKPKEPSWYVSSRPFNPILFSSNINSLSNSLTSAIASQPSSKHSFVSSGSGFSSGGGFSGGGFGGGGGRSW